MSAVGHAVGLERLFERDRQRRAVHADVDGDGPGAPEQPVQMGLQEQQPALVQAQSLPDPVAQAEAGVEDRDPGLGARNQRPVQPHPHGLVARIGGVVLAAGHGLSLRPILARYGGGAPLCAY